MSEDRRLQRERHRATRDAMRQDKQHAAERWSIRMRMPALTGTPNQVTAAMRVRRKLVTAALRAEPAASDTILARARTITSARWWLDRRDTTARKPRHRGC
jgi:hypothetical protein